MNPCFKHLDRIEFAVTMACTGRCKHCSEGEHAAQGAYIDGALAARAVRQVCERYQIQSLMTFGGEPLLYPQAVRAIHQAGREMGIPRRTLITNGYFCKNGAQIRETARLLAESGVNDILLSADAFHQEFIPLDRVTEFAVSALKEGIPIRTHPAWLVSREDGNLYNLRTREILQKFCSLGIEPSEGNVIFPCGNAKKYLGEYFAENTEASDPYEEDPEDIRTLCISPGGEVLHGNLYHEDIPHILNTYLPRV